MNNNSSSSDINKINKLSANGVFIGKNLVMYYEDSSDFVNAWPGIKLWLESEVFGVGYVLR